jgi:hypothetical protein
MANMGMAEAARRAGVERSTLYRKAKKGLIALKAGPGGTNRIEIEELLRVYPEADQSQQAATAARHRSKPRSPLGSNGSDAGAIACEAELLRQQVRSLERDKDDLRAERDRLLAIIERLETQLAACGRPDSRINELRADAPLLGHK